MFVNPKPSGRRIPTQERSRQRVERILDAASQVFATQGFEAATMDGIALAAETSIGSIYQFFPNKLAVFNALAARHHDAVRTFLDGLLASPLVERPLPELLDAAIDAIVAFHETSPGFRAMWVSLQLTEQVVTEAEALNREIARWVESVLAGKLAGLHAKKRPEVATMVVQVVGAMLIFTARRPPNEAKALIRETKVMLRCYLASYEGGAPTASKVRSRR